MKPAKNFIMYKLTIMNVVFVSNLPPSRKTYGLAKGLACTQDYCSGLLFHRDAIYQANGLTCSIGDHRKRPPGLTGSA